MFSKWTGALLLLALLAAPALAADQAELIKKREAKLAEPFLKNAPWLTDYDQALKTAQDSKKLIFAYFTRSYAG